MADEILHKTGTQIRFCISASFSPADAGTNWTDGTPTNVAVFNSNISNGVIVQSDKCDLGSRWAERYELFGCVNFNGAPTIGGTIDYYWAPSTSGTQANGNTAGNSGAAASITSPVVFTRLCIFIGQLTVHDGVVPQNGFIGILEPPGRYGQLIMVNNSGVSTTVSQAETHQVLVPIINEIQ